MAICVGMVVEGHGDEEALPILVRRIAVEVAPAVAFHTTRPIRIPKGKLLKSGELERAVTLAKLKCGPEHIILVVLDADDHCPAELAPTLLARVQGIPNTRAAVVLAKREFETWFIAGILSLRGQRGVRTDAEPPHNPEEITGAKEWLTKQMPATSPYSETLDQPAFAAAVSLAEARSVPSFDKLCRDVAGLLASDPIDT